MAAAVGKQWQAEQEGQHNDNPNPSRRGIAESKAWWIENKSPVALLVLIGAILGFLSPNFFTADNLLNIPRQTSVNAIMAVGMTLVILTAGIDLSVGSVLALCGALAATMVAMELPIALVIPHPGAGALFGGISGPHHRQGKVRPLSPPWSP